MGCDIHLIVEHRQNGKWRQAPFADFDDRSYLTFAALADVRNRWEIVPVSPPKGLPKDSKYGEERWDLFGEHSFSWLDLAELNHYDWNQTVTDSGYVGLEGFKEYVKNGRPNGWCQGVWGGKIAHVSNEEMTQRVENPKKFPQDQVPYTLVQWPITLSEECWGFMEFLKELNDYAHLNKIDPVDLRIVFGFDS